VASEPTSTGEKTGPIVPVAPPAATTPRTVEDLLHENDRLRRLNATLDEAVTARDEFIATLGHELRNPLSPMVLQIGHLIDLIKREEGGAVQTSWLEPRLRAFEGRMQRLVDVLDRLLDVSLMNGGRLRLMLDRDVDLAEVTREVCASFERELAVARCPLTLELAPAAGAWDRVRLEQIVRNLVSNAIRYGAGRPIHVSVSADDAQAQLRIRDQGVGIAPADQARIFERFERAGRRPQGAGFGLGLWIVRNLCAAFGGRVEVESELGKGATFVVTLPRRAIA
jgi:signal transduction histidine kinase